MELAAPTEERWQKCALTSALTGHCEASDEHLLRQPPITSLRSSAQRALFDRIKSSLREVFIADRGNTIKLTFYYDGEITEEDEDMARDAGAEVISDFPGPYMIDWAHMLRLSR
jgi:hypothetical protein